MKLIDKYKILSIVSLLLSVITIILVIKENNFGARTESVWRQYNSNTSFSGFVGFGTTTPLYPIEVIDTASSTIAIGGAFKSGCIRIGDSSNGTSTVYITASGSTILGTTTKPSICR